MASKQPENGKTVSLVKASSVTEGVCDMCCHEAKHWALGQCDHPTCLRCCTKLRLLCGQKECPVCRFALKKVLLVCHLKPFTYFTNFSTWRSDKKSGLFFQNKSLQDAYYGLMENLCTNCTEPPFRSFKLLRDHMKRAHNLYYCDICTDNLKLFPSEFKTYTRAELTQHRREGDKDDMSHKGHPLCNFCDDRYLDNDQLHAHLRKNHFWCHFCESDGKQDYFRDYVLLRRHFRDEHFLCEEGQCKNEKFTSVFRSKLDFQAHRANAHTKGLSKAAVKQLKQLDVGFSYGRDREEEEPSIIRKPRYAGRVGEHPSRGARSGHSRTRELLEVTKPKPSDPPKLKKPSPPSPPKISPVEETKAPPGFGSQPLPTAAPVASATPFAILSGGQGYEGSSTFDPYGGVTDLQTLNPVVHNSSRLVNSSSRAEPYALAKPPPGFDFSKNTRSLQQVEETEWPDLTAGSVTEPSVFQPRVSEPPPFISNITAAVMNTNKQPNLLSESSFPSLSSSGPPTTTSPSTSSTDNSWPLLVPSLDPPPSEQSNILKFTVASTTSTSSASAASHGRASGLAPSYQAAIRLDGVDLSSRNFPPMTSAPVIVGGSDVESGSGNQNNYLPTGKQTSTTTEASAKKSKQSQMIEKVRKAFDYDKEKFTRFKTLMGWFKNGEITVEEFKAQSYLLFGGKWQEIGPELAEMMPNHEKKNELLSSFGVRSGSGKNVTKSAKSRRRAPVSTKTSTTPSVWGSGPVVPGRNFNAMSTGLSHKEYPTLGSAIDPHKTLPQPTTWNVVIQ